MFTKLYKSYDLCNNNRKKYGKRRNKFWIFSSGYLFLFFVYFRIMPPTVSQVEQNSKYNGISRSRKFDEIEETAETNDVIADTGDLTMSDLCSKQVVKRKRASTEDNNDPQCEAESSQTTTTVEVDKENNNPQINQDEIVEENVEKKQKTEGKKEKKKYGLRKSKNTSSSQSAKTNRCNHCRQDLEEIHFYPGHPNNAEEEAVALISFTMDKDEQDVEFEREEDRRPQIKLTNFRYVFFVILLR